MTRSRAGTPAIVRGHLWSGHRGERFFLGISNNQRNARLQDFLAVRLSTSRKPPLPSIVHVTDDDGRWTGAVCCDEVEKVYGDEVTRDYGALRPATMARVDDARRSALSL